MLTEVLVRKDSYHDSVLLMRLSRELETKAGVVEAVVAMATPHNRDLLAARGFARPTLASAGPNDLVIALRLDGTTVAEAETVIDALLEGRPAAATAESQPVSLGAALALCPEINLVLISLPGEHAGREARRALAQDRHVMLFSDNVSVEEEVALKTLAHERGLLMMGPDCGTAIINGKPLAFANVVRRGKIGIVGAAGTGIQEISSCIHRLGGGVSQAIGTGGRDLSAAVGALTTLTGIQALGADPDTAVLVVVSKPPAAKVAAKVVAAVRATGKPAVVHFVGAPPHTRQRSQNVVFATSLAGAAKTACRLSGLRRRGRTPGFGHVLATRVARALGSEARLVGLFCGGTTGAEALALLTGAGIAVHSNLHKDGPLAIGAGAHVDGHLLLDLGDDELTRGRPHPMIEPELRNDRLVGDLEAPRPTLLLFDLVLGYGAHPDPAGVLARGLAAARARNPALVAVASVTGTDEDPQSFTSQRRRLLEAGVLVMPDNRTAADFVAAVLCRTTARRKASRPRKKASPAPATRAARQRGRR